VATVINAFWNGGTGVLETKQRQPFFEYSSTLQTPVPTDVDALVMKRLQPILRRLAALEE
jgi:trehalose-6-phosphatase